MSKPIRVLAVDDSAVARQQYRTILDAGSGIELVATAPNAEMARRRIPELDPDVVVLDIHMPGVDGLTFLKWLMRNLPTPVVISSTLNPDAAKLTMDAFALGAVDVVCKGDTRATGAWGEDFRDALVRAVRGAAKAAGKIKSTRNGKSLVLPDEKAATAQRVGAEGFRVGNVVVIASSTGGTEAVAKLIAAMPEGFPPTLVAQHMPPVYTKSFAQRLDALGPIRVLEAAGGEKLTAGTVLIAPGGLDLELRPSPKGPITEIFKPTTKGPRPSGDRLLTSAARVMGKSVTGLVLTGMGNDGAQGLLSIRRGGGVTIAQDEASSVCYGMPKEAKRLGAAQYVLGLEQIMPRLCELLSATRRMSASAARASKEA